MPEKYTYHLRSHYPNMRPEDVAIWEHFILKYPDMYEEVAYDVLVGSPPGFPTIVGEGPASDDLRLYKKKIDVVGYRLGRVDIIELKPRAGAAALGQVNGYKTLYIRDISADPAPFAVLITDELRTDMQMLADEAKVLLFVV